MHKPNHLLPNSRASVVVLEQPSIMMCVLVMQGLGWWWHLDQVFGPEALNPNRNTSVSILDLRPDFASPRRLTAELQQL